MALVTVQRSPSPSDTPETLSSDLADLVDGDSSCRSGQRTHNLSESYLSFKGAALILPQSECLRTVTQGVNTDIHTHLQSMFYLLRPQDTIKMAIKLESSSEGLIRYMAVVSTTGVHDTEECVIVGVDIQQEATIGLVLPVWADMTIKLDGDGGFSITTNSRHHIFKPVSVQAMWSAWQCLNKISDIARLNRYYPVGLTHTWVEYYKVTSAQQCINEWNAMEDLESQRPEVLTSTKSSDMESLERLIRGKLKEIMMTVDLEEVTSKYLRERLEEALDRSLKQYKQFIDQEMIVILRQMDSPSQIFDFLYLGSEWNASNLEELNKNKIGYILNVTREIDNFFPGLYKYKNIRVYDVEDADLLRYWEETYRFISEARWNNSRVLVHCKMGVSRSASTVISFVMKEKNWSLDEAYKYVKSKRSVIKPNDGFMKQLKMYEGILIASNQRHNELWRSTSVGNLTPDRQSSSVSAEHTALGTSMPTPLSSFGSHRHDSLPLLAQSHSLAPYDSKEYSSDESLDINEYGDEPIQFRMEGDLELSAEDVSQSDEVFQTEKRDLPLPSVVLISHRMKTDDKLAQAPIIDVNSSESSDDASDEGGSSHVSGGYDVHVLEAVQDEALKGRSVNNSAGRRQDTSAQQNEWSLMHLHPDVIQEIAINRYRNRHMMAKLKKQSRRVIGRQQCSTPVVVISESIKQSAAQKSSPIAIRVKPDDFWIKDEQLTVVDQEDNAKQSDFSDGAEALATGASANIVHLSQSPQPGAIQSSPVGSSTSDTSESIQAYIKEDIPWSPGTVRRQAQDLEHRLSTSDLLPASDSSSSPLCQRRIDSVGNQSPTNMEYQMHSAGATNSPTSDGQPSDISSWSVTGPLTSHSGYNSDGGSTASTSLDSPRQSRAQTVSHIYQSEDIQLEPGHVLRTKMEIEHRERSCSYSAMLPGKDTQPVRRSSSCKDDRPLPNRGRFDRTSERRRTCLPVLHPSPTSEKIFMLAGVTRDESSTDPSKQNEIPTFLKDAAGTGQKVIYTIGDDALEIEQGKVRRQTRDFEDAVHEDMEPSSKSRPVSDTVVQDEVEVLIRQGSVKRTKQDMLKKFAASAGMDSVANKSQQQVPSDKKETGEKSRVPSPAVMTETTSEQSGSSLTKDNQEKVAMLLKPHRKLRHSKSSPQLCLGAPAYPKEEEITWSVGTVRQQKEAIERKGKNLDEEEGDESTRARSSLNNETLKLIREVGTARMKLLEDGSPTHDGKSENGPGLVRRLSDQIQGKSASEEIKKRMLMLEKKAHNSDSSGSASAVWKSTVTRSASMHEPTSRLRGTSVNRSKSVKESFSTKSAVTCEQCFTIREGIPVVKTERCHRPENSGKDADSKQEQCASKTVCSHLQEKKAGNQKKPGIMEVKKYFENTPNLSDAGRKVPKAGVKRVKSDGFRSQPSETSSHNLFKSTMSVTVSSSVKNVSEIAEAPASHNLVSQKGRNLLIKTAPSSTTRCSSPMQTTETLKTDHVAKASEPCQVAPDKMIQDVISKHTNNGTDSSLTGFSSVNITSSEHQCETGSHDSKELMTLASRMQSGLSMLTETTSKTASPGDTGSGISGVQRKKKDIVQKLSLDSQKKETYSCTDCSSHEASSVSRPELKSITGKVDHKSHDPSNSVVSRDSIQSKNKVIIGCAKSPKILAKSHEIKVRDSTDVFEEQKPESSDLSKSSKDSGNNPLHSIKEEVKMRERSSSSPPRSSVGSVNRVTTETEDHQESTDIVLNPVFKEQAIKALFPEQQASKSACMGIHGTRLHRRATPGPGKISQSKDSTQQQGSGTVKEQGSSGQKMCRLHGKTHPLTKLCPENDPGERVLQAKHKKPCHNTL